MTGQGGRSPYSFREDVALALAYRWMAWRNGMNRL